MAPTPKRIQRALKTAASKVPTAKLPARAVSRGARTNFTPAPGEVPVAVLRIQILGCTDLIAADRNGTSDPYVVVSFTGRREQTPVVKKSLDPTYDAKSATFDFPLYMSHAELISSIELVVWDKDTFGKDYLGEVSLDLDTWFKNDILAFEDERLEVPQHPSAPFFLALH
ncbi:hypothetical protein BOTBODRAFT_160511 [Botryobasidium botryosum FD-172 SS1]|uniref:C2 domain-containing protein n=1 Tax=Botryobasidium botryosum (strain FD-172 SS1) TaxID=930990 RepID=A0A067MCR0_BOTB1|nr:hypothetical protein BOTBODRAFT_160511 [Botryobasidium botryosum FD-172 SS1]